MRRLRRLLQTTLATGVFMFGFAAPLLAVASPVVSSVSAACDDRFLGIPPWYRGLTSGADCTIAGPTSTDGIATFIWKIVLNVIEMALVIIIYIAVFFILFGGFLYMTGGSNPSSIERARKTILQAVVGLIIGLGSVAILNLLFNGLFGSASTSSQGGINGIVTMTGQELLTNALNLTYFIAGVVAVIIIIIAGLLYVTSSGDPGKVTKAKNTLLYAVVGLVIILLAFTITAFVTGRFSS